MLTIVYNFFASRSYEWGTAAVSATVISSAGTVLYAVLLLWKRRRIARMRKGSSTRANLYSEQSYYTNYIPNMYPSAVRTASLPPQAPVHEDDPVNQQMALLMLRDARPSPDASSSTFRIDLPEDREEQDNFGGGQELVGTPQQSHTAAWTRDRANSRPNSLGENQAWQQWQDRGRTQHRPSNSDLNSNHSRGLSREERRREIELGQAVRP